MHAWGVRSDGAVRTRAETVARGKGPAGTPHHGCLASHQANPQLGAGIPAQNSCQTYDDLYARSSPFLPEAMAAGGALLRTSLPADA